MNGLLNRLISAKGIILDGYPRTEQQVKLLFDLLHTKYPGLHLRVVKFDISDESVIKRLSSRLMCQNKDCQAVYSMLPDSGLGTKAV